MCRRGRPSAPLRSVAHRFPPSLAARQGGCTPTRAVGFPTRHVGFLTRALHSQRVPLHSQRVPMHNRRVPYYVHTDLRRAATQVATLSRASWETLNSLERVMAAL